jgi:crotonobetainyl-CoA:carnitine CoA-transferase CaiB-like acyl-CoA transferase
MIIEVEHPTAGNLELIGCPVKLSETPWQLRYAPPLVGQHTEEVLSEVLPPDRIAALRAEGAIG